MGRKTFESLPKGGLPNRKNVVLTTMPEAGFINCFACESMHDALDICEKEENIFIIGGSLVYRQGLGIADKMYLTRIHGGFTGAFLYQANIIPIHIPVRLSRTLAPVIVLQAKIEQLPVSLPAYSIVIRYVHPQLGLLLYLLRSAFPGLNNPPLS